MTISNTELIENNLPTKIDPRELRNTLGLFATGVTVITTKDNESRPIGITANSFSSLSLDPALVLWSLDLKSPNVDLFQEGCSFAINILGSRHDELAMQFAKPQEDKFKGINYSNNAFEVPLLEGAQAHLECTVTKAEVQGDHLLIIGQVDAMASEPGEPLVFYRGRFAQIQE